MAGAQTLPSLIALYDVAGQIRVAFIALQEQVRIAMGSHVQPEGER
ncbi:MAG TPA: hypothetical protein VNS79_03615 [Sphingobium sp.]|nr:hypothetical protein [Sphingobium sp.]